MQGALHLQFLSKLRALIVRRCSSEPGKSLIFVLEGKSSGTSKRLDTWCHKKSEEPQA
jgi:hypothetical protein